jgi:hypothetical protein
LLDPFLADYITNMPGNKRHENAMKRRTTTLIKSPLAWHMAAAPATHPAVPVLAERGGTQLRTPKASDQIGKVFIVVGQDVRRCLVCE